jgi:hypothetical protein
MIAQMDKSPIPTVEVVLEDPGKYSWRIVFRDPDTGHEVGAPTVSIELFNSPDAALQAGRKAGEEMMASSFVMPPPSSTA